MSTNSRYGTSHDNHPKDESDVKCVQSGVFRLGLPAELRSPEVPLGRQPA